MADDVDQIENVVNHVSFDEMEQVMEGKSQAEASEDNNDPGESTAVQFKEADTDDSSGIVQKTQEASDPKEKIKKSLSKEEKSEYSPEADAEIEADTGVPDPEKTDVKMLNGKYGDQEVELAADTTLVHNVDGEEVEVSVQELLNNYAGKIPWDKRFQELGQEKQVFEGQVQNLQAHVDHFVQLTQGEDKMKALDFLATLGGLDPIQFRSELRESLIPQVEKYLTLDEDGRRALSLQEENELLKQQRERELQQKQQLEQNWQTAQAEQAAQQQYGMDAETWNERKQELINSGENIQVTPELIGQYELRIRAYDHADKLVAQVGQELLNEEQLIDEVVSILLEEDYSDEEIVNMLHEASGTKPKKQKAAAVSEKVRQSQKSSAPAKASSSSKNVPLSFEDL